MAQIQGLVKVVETLKNLAAKSRKDHNVSVIVGYTAAYALYLHERVAMKWRGFPRDRSIRLGKDKVAYTGYTPNKKHGLFWGPTGQAKFLEQPARELSPILGKIVAKAMLEKKTMAQGLLLAGLRLQRESQKKVPIDTGNLRASAFTRME